ncbi:kinase phosphorylation protein-domain-containing protein, partial [Chytriomyces sp. MP71]
MFSGPIREGNRGGSGLFKWDDVKDDKHRENYLGHSINAPVGRWQKGKDLVTNETGWYSKEKDAIEVAAVQQKEFRDVKEKEAEAMAEALGLRTKKTTQSSVSQAEIVRLLKLDAAANEEFASQDEASKTKGIGFGR